MIGLLFLLFCAWIVYQFYIGDRANDSLPVILSSQVRMERVDDNLFNNDEYKDGVICSKEEIETTFQASQEQFYIEPQKEYFKCTKFITTGGTFYYIYPGGTSAYGLFLKTTDGVELVTKTYGEYPGNGFMVKGGTNDIIISFSGWRNPRKVLKFSIN